MATEAKMLAALDRASNTIGKKRVAQADPAKLCEYYKEIRPLITALLPLIKKIPVYGAKIAQIVEFLMLLADKVCPAI